MVGKPASPSLEESPHRLTRVRRIALVAFITLASAGCDQAAKHIARATLAPMDGISFLAGALHFELTQNPGGFLSLGAALPAEVRRIFFGVAVPALLAAIAIGAIWARGLRRTQVVGLALLVGGGLGNLIDRLLHDGAVTDFVRLDLGPLSTGVFNLGDVVITLGVVVFAFVRDGARDDRDTIDADRGESTVAYDEGLAERIREWLGDRRGISEKKMFGGLCFLASGNMCCGIVADELMVRVGPEAYAECLAQPHAREMDFTGRAMKGLVYVATPGFESDEDLAAWLARGLAFAESLPER